ncbi:MAG: ABC transporter ATP-binding protein/permease [Clostridia bacterium]|nr:ABC transporter ATP-binding protein/permease [Clostridia bacterium]
MLSLKNIYKVYSAGDTEVTALKDVSLQFRESEFVSILGHSGCGKTTLLNIIGGLDKYTDGDLFINGRSTKEFCDTDWDIYRNHSIGFVFQSYNLIPHQSVLSNVELALTLSGVSKAERRKRATEALEKVGLGDQINKKPNQMSGGQMQRVAIARALVNNPDILLADEPTGALDSETSVQIMELLKEIAKDKLVIMVTHNPDLATEYSSRIIRLSDGVITDDTNPFDGSEEKAPVKDVKGKRSMSFFTALSLSLNNLLTKKTRTILTSFAGSIGIIGIALILALSNGIQAYIDQIQEETLSSYPILIESESVDLTELITTLMGTTAQSEEHTLDKVYASPVLKELINTMTNATVNKNNLKAFSAFLEDENNEINYYITALHYSYDFDFNVFLKDKNENIIKSEPMELMQEVMGVSSSDNSLSQESMAMSSQTIPLYEQMISGKDGELINSMLYEQYDIIYGNWPTAYNEVVLVVNENNEISDLALLALGLKTVEESKSLMEGNIPEGDVDSWSYEDICGLKFKLVPSCNYYAKSSADNSFIDISKTDAGMNYLYDNGIDMKVSGIIRKNPDVSSAMLKGSVAYTKALTDYIIDVTENSDIVKAQKENPETDIIKNLPFKTDDYKEPEKEQKAKDFKEYASSLKNDKKTELYKDIISTPTKSYVSDVIDAQMENLTRDYIETMMIDSYAKETGMEADTIKSYVSQMSDKELFDYVEEVLEEKVKQEYKNAALEQIKMMPEDQFPVMLMPLINSKSTDELAELYDAHMPPVYSESNLEENLKLLGSVDKNDPDTISIYAATFEDKDKIADAIAKYNESVIKEDQISYTDYVALMMSSITTIINVISYVLVAFVSISLVVSSIMIGIITYISVLERTKEIGILRAIGASKKDIARVFNAETLIVGFSAGAIGILFTLLLCIPINAIIRYLSGIVNIGASLPVVAAIILVVISMLLTFISGLIPSGIAAKKDPVEALRSE